MDTMQERKNQTAAAADLMRTIINETGKGFLGKKDITELAVKAVTAGLHVLIEDVSGVGKTTLVHCIAKVTGLDFGRIQFTPDLLPGDITGMTIWDPVKREFIFREGPIRHQLLLADELNRAPARTQSALLEAMQENTVTVDGTRYPLPAPFIVAATQNPYWYAGTYSLPESQLDRFGLSLTPGYPETSIEALILESYKEKDPVDNVSQVAQAEQLISAGETIRQVEIKQNVLEFAVRIGEATRTSKSFQTGLSTRGLQHLIRMAQAQAVLELRDFLIPEDLVSALIPTARHRLSLTPEARSEGKPVEHFLEQLTHAMQIPY